MVDVRRLGGGLRSPSTVLFVKETTDILFTACVFFMKEEQKPITQTYITCKVNYVVIIISIGAGVFVAVSLGVALGVFLGGFLLAIITINRLVSDMCKI